MQEQEAVLLERFSGLPVIKLPSTLLEAANSGDAAAQASLAAHKGLITNVRIDEQMGVLLPSDHYPAVSHEFTAELTGLPAR